MKDISKSPWVVHYDGSSCNGCDIEVLASLTPVYDAERFGVVNTGDPMHADIFLVTGGVNTLNQVVVKEIYNQMPDPKVVVAVGTCACTGGIFKECYNIIGGVDKVIPVDVYVPGCAARPQSIIDGIVKAKEVFKKKCAEQVQADMLEIKDISMEDRFGFPIKTEVMTGEGKEDKLVLKGGESVKTMSAKEAVAEAEVIPMPRAMAAPKEVEEKHYPRMNPELCVYCTLCAKRCPMQALTVDRAEKKWELDKSLCVGCGLCRDNCPKKCIELG